MEGAAPGSAPEAREAREAPPTAPDGGVSGSATPADERAGAWRRTGVALLLVLAIVVADQVSKAAVMDWLGLPGHPESVEGFDRDCHPYHRRVVLVGEDKGWLAFLPSLNTGAAWGVLRDRTEPLVFGRILATIVVLVLLHRAPRAQRAYRAGLTCVLGGAAGNLLDNLLTGPKLGEEDLFRPVRYFVDVYFFSEARGWDYHFPTFNVGDSFITIGAVLLVISSLFGSRAPEPGGDSDERAG